MNKKELYKKWEEAYNQSARAWNSLPGLKLIYPQDRFIIIYCKCRHSEGFDISNYDGVDLKICRDCHHILPGEFA